MFVTEQTPKLNSSSTIRYLITSHGMNVSWREKHRINRVLACYSARCDNSDVVNVTIDVPHDCEQRFIQDFEEVAVKCRAHNLTTGR